MRLGLAFEIGEADLSLILRAGGYAFAASPTDPVEAELEIRQLVHGTGMTFVWGSGCQHYMSTNQPGRHLLWRTNDPVVFFFLAMPRG